MNKLNKICVTDIKDILMVSFLKNDFRKINDRKCYGLSFCTEGRITYSHNDKKYVADANHAVILPKGQSYTIYGNKSGLFPVINFDCTDFLCDTIMIIPIDNVDSVMRDFDQIKKLHLFDRNRAKIMSIFYNIIHALSASEVSEYNILLPAVRYIEENYPCTSLTNSVLADKCNISEVYFRKLFLHKYGVSPRQYIIDVRITKAKQLLSEGFLKISVISERCGFSNPYHFCRLFKEKTGLTPTEYLKQNKIIKI